MITDDAPNTWQTPSLELVADSSATADLVAPIRNGNFSIPN